MSTGADATNSFPSLGEVFQGQVFKTKFDRDVFFLRRIRNSYPAQWAPLLGANITETDYVLAPDKLLRFVEELGTAMAGTDDIAATTNLAAIASDPAFYANTNGYQPLISQAAASALIKVGPRGRQALADSFNEGHYRTDPASLEVVAAAVGKSADSDPRLAAALAATAFTFTATNGGYYARCTREATRNLLCLPGGILTVRTHLNANEVLDNPGRFQAVVDGIAAMHTVELTADLAKIADAVAAKLKLLPDSANPYREDLSQLQVRIKGTIEELREHGGKGGL